MTRQSRRVSIVTNLEIFSSWWNDDKSWFTDDQIAKIIGCNISSLRPAYSWLRSHGYIVSARWVQSSLGGGCNVRNIKKGKLSELRKMVNRKKAEVNWLGKVLKEEL